jgi:vacuolar protein sorting-associated protein 26
MEVQIIRKEVVNVANVAPIQKVLTRFEIMDGGPIKNETIPIRFFLKPYDLTPTLTNINNRFSIQYFINIVLTDVEDRKYFKQHEIFFHRIQKVKKKKSESEDNGITEIKNEVKNENKNVISNESDNGNTNDGNNNEEEKLDE